MTTASERSALCSAGHHSRVFVVSSTVIVADRMATFVGLTIIRCTYCGRAL